MNPLFRFLPAAIAFITCFGAPLIQGQTPVKEPREFLPPPFDRYLERRVAQLSGAQWMETITRENWPGKSASMRRELQGMLGLDPWPARTPLNAVTTGTVEGDKYIVEKVHFESMPGLYVTADLYRPSEAKGPPMPAILYVCGHSDVVENGVSMGNKSAYQHHGIWFARHGYVCLVVDTIQLGEIRGAHHGTYKFGRWWWAARGYTPAGVEAWNGIRALDYLETRPEVDRTRLGMTGRSGGGAYTWWVAALDERVQAAVPTAGITTLRNHVIDGAIEGHCDCMFMVNTSRWDFDRVAALMAPRALLIANSDSDPIFPLDGVLQIYNRTRSLYKKLGAEDHIGLHIVEGPHQDTQPLNTGAFHWLNRFLKGASRMDLTDEPAKSALAPASLKVFGELPKDEVVTTIDEKFVAEFQAPSGTPSAAEWSKLRDEWLNALQNESFRAWPAQARMLVDEVTTHKGEELTLTECKFESEPNIFLKVWVLHEGKLSAQESVVLNVLEDNAGESFRRMAAAGFPKPFPGVAPDVEQFSKVKKALLGTRQAMAYFSPRGVGLTVSADKLKHLRRRLLLVGESLESGQAWDILKAAAALHCLDGFEHTPLWISGEKNMACNALYASLFIPSVQRLELHGLPASHRTGPAYLNVLKHLDIPQAVALAAERTTVALYTDETAPWEYPQKVAKSLGWPDSRLELHRDR